MPNMGAAFVQFDIKNAHPHEMSRGDITPNSQAGRRSFNPRIKPTSARLNVEKQAVDAGNLSLLLDVEPLEAELYKNRAELKMLVGQIAMHLASKERAYLFSEIDRLLNIDDWEDESRTIDPHSFSTYLRFMLYSKPGRLANLGVSASGAVMAGWHGGGSSLHVEFLPNDKCIALINSSSDRGVEALAWRGHVARLSAVLDHNGAADAIG